MILYIEQFLKNKPIILQLLKFGAIGGINTALDFIVLNLLSKTLGINEGIRLGLVNVCSFTLATLQSYYWNKSWAFGSEDAGVIRNFVRLCAMGLLGAGGILSVLIGARFLGADLLFYGSTLAVFLVAEIFIWEVFGLGKGSAPEKPMSTFAVFLLVSVIGLLINTLCVAILSSTLASRIDIFGNLDTVKNVAKIFATVVSLIWNFVGYKLLVFKK